MFSILHGDDEVKVHNELLRQIDVAKKSGVQIVRLQAKKLSIADIDTALATQELFATEKLVIIDSLHGLPKSKFKDTLIDYIASTIQKIDPLISVVFVENKILTATQLKKFPTANAQIFKLPVLLFTCMDSLGLKKPSELISLFHKVVETQEPELVFAMLCRQIRMLLLYASDGIYEGAPFGRSKIERQSQAFTLDVLRQHHQKLLLIDHGQKTSRSSLSLTQEIDLFLSQV